VKPDTNKQTEQRNIILLYWCKTV